MKKEKEIIKREKKNREREIKRLSNNVRIEGMWRDWGILLISDYYGDINMYIMWFI